MLGLDTGDGDFDIWGISRDYYPSNATAANAWGLRWNGANNDFEFVGGGTNRVILDMDAGNVTATGNISATGTIGGSNYSGTHSGASSGTNTGDQTNISGNAATATYATSAGSAPNASNSNSFYNVTAGEGNGIKFWASDSYKISMGVSSTYQYGTVTDYSIKTQMNSGDPGRGFTWGREGVVPIASLNATSGNMQTAGTLTTGGSILPLSNGTLNLGSSGARWNTLFTSDLSLSNGIGDYTVVEGEDDLFLYNNKRNKVYKFMLQEVKPEDATPKRPE